MTEAMAGRRPRPWDLAPYVSRKALIEEALSDCADSLIVLTEAQLGRSAARERARAIAADWLNAAHADVPYTEMSLRDLERYPE